MTLIVRLALRTACALAAVTVPTIASAAPLFVGLNGAAKLQITSDTGAILSEFGPDGASAGASDGAQQIYVAVPGDTTSNIEVWNTSGMMLNSIPFAPGSITDLAYGGSNTLWVSEAGGGIYQVSLSSGNATLLFNAGAEFAGIATDGTYLYTSTGLGSSVIHKWTTAGDAVDGDVYTGLLDTLGLAYDSSNGSFWVGGVDVLGHVAADNTTTYAMNGAVTGVEVGVDIGGPGPGPGPGPGEVPEPSTFVFMGAGLAAVAIVRSRQYRRFLPAVLAGLFCAGANAAVSITALTPSVTSPQPVGTPVTFTAAASDTDAGTLQYRFRVRPAGGTYRTVIDYGPANAFTWPPMDTEGIYDIEASVKNATTGSNIATSISFMASSRVTGGNPVVSSTSHPLVALYSAPPCPTGSKIRVRFKRASDANWSSTDLRPCTGSTSVNFYVAGMYPSSQYMMRQDVISGLRITSGATLSFTTGAYDVAFPSTSVMLPPKWPTNLSEPVLLAAVLQGTSGVRQYASDLNGTVIWYYRPQLQYIARPVPGGTILGFFGQNTDIDHSGVREFDLAGYTVRETNVTRMNEQLTARGMRTITTFHHDARKLPNGMYMVLGQSELRTDAQGPMQDVVGDQVLVLDSNFQLVWAWDAFDHLNVSQPAVLNEHCGQGGAGCVLLQLNGDASAADWTHTNALGPTADGNIIISVRHHDAVYKINYANGTGDGSVIWKLGRNGDFTFIGGDPVWPWFSHQHDVEYENSNTISLFDNGNTRANGNSRGQVLRIDEANRTATVLINSDLGTYSAALGSAQRLSNGNYHFLSGFIGTGAAESTETNSAGTAIYRLHTPIYQYRSFRLRDLYSAP